MYHVFRIEPVVPQLVEHDFIRREIDASAWESAAELFFSKQECRLAELVAVGPVLEVTDRADRQEKDRVRRFNCL